MSVDSSRPVVSTPTLAQATGFPVRSIPSSASAHIVIVVVVLLLGLAPVMRDPSPYTRQLPQRLDLQDQPTDAPLLPEIESSSASASSPASASARSAKGRNAASSASSMPLIHQRRQHIISNTPDATNTVQTILQPGLEHPRLLATLPIHTMVRLAPPQHTPLLTAPTLSAVVRPVAPPAPAAVPQPTIPKVHSSNIDTVPLTSATELANSPRIPAFASSGRTFQPPKPPPPPPPAAAKPSAPTVAANSTPAPPTTAAPSTGSDSRNLLVVNALEITSTLAEKDIPPGEIHGRFEVAVSPSLPEAATTGGSSSSAGVSSSGVAATGNGGGKGNAHSASGASTGGTHGNGSGRGTATVASSGAGHGSGLGNGTDAGTGRASGAGMGNGSGTSTAGGNGSAPFSGMTIVGGTSSSGLNSASANGNVDVKNPPGTYGMTIVSSAGSGGGLRDYGVFNDGPVFTVYVNVARIGIHGARWALQYNASREVRIEHAGYPLTPPFPHTEVLPLLPPALVAANVGRLFVFQATLKPDGTLEGFRVLETPDARIIDPILSTLTKWTFEPASMGTDKVPIKILMGIPIAAAMADTGVSQQAGTHTPADTALHTNAQ